MAEMERSGWIRDASWKQNKVLGDRLDVRVREEVESRILIYPIHLTFISSLRILWVCFNDYVFPNIQTVPKGQNLYLIISCFPTMPTYNSSFYMVNYK